MRWFRFYAEALDDPKVQKLPGDHFKNWVNILCLAAKNDGVLPPAEDMAFALRLTDEAMERALAELTRRGLLDETDAGLVPHNWDGRQPISDRDPTALSRKQKQREKERHADVTRDASVTDADVTRTDKIRIEEIREEKSKHPPTPRKREEATATPPRVSERPRNEIFDALKDECGYDPAATLSSPEATRIGKAAADIKKAGGTVEEVAVRAERYRRKYGGDRLTVNALASHWGELATEPVPRASPNGNGFVPFPTAAERRSAANAKAFREHAEWVRREQEMNGGVPDVSEGHSDSHGRLSGDTGHREPRGLLGSGEDIRRW